MLPGGHGDALVVEWGKGRKVEHRMLVDAGTVFSYDAVRTRLLAMPDTTYEAFVITHVDEDHIGGAVSLLDDFELRHRIDDVWFNGYIHSDQGGNVLGPMDGERLTKLIVDGRFAWNQAFEWPAEAEVDDELARSVGGPIVVPSTGDLPCIPLPGGARVHLLSPDGPKLKRMAAVWEREVIKNHLVPGAGTDELPRTPRPHQKHVASIPTRLTRAKLAALATTSTDGSEANGSSIAFILEVPGPRGTTLRALLGADAHASVMRASLQRFAKQAGEERVRLDLCKLSHHGSRANISKGLMAVIDADTYLVSSNGENHGLPNDAAIACAILGSPRPATFHCNYSSERTVPWVKRAPSVGARFVLPKEGKQGLRVVAGS
jgi:beta-lactamase superfamily II metal-dependent hydrolase